MNSRGKGKPIKSGDRNTVVYKTLTRIGHQKKFRQCLQQLIQNPQVVLAKVTVAPAFLGSLEESTSSSESEVFVGPEDNFYSRNDKDKIVEAPVNFLGFKVNNAGQDSGKLVEIGAKVTEEAGYKLLTCQEEQKLERNVCRDKILAANKSCELKQHNGSTRNEPSIKTVSKSQDSRVLNSLVCHTCTKVDQMPHAISCSINTNETSNMLDMSCNNKAEKTLLIKNTSEINKENSFERTECQFSEDELEAVKHWWKFYQPIFSSQKVASNVYFPIENSSYFDEIWSDISDSKEKNNFEEGKTSPAISTEDFLSKSEENITSTFFVESLFVPTVIPKISPPAIAKVYSDMYPASNPDLYPLGLSPKSEISYEKDSDSLPSSQTLQPPLPSSPPPALPPLPPSSQPLQPPLPPSAPPALPPLPPSSQSLQPPLPFSPPSSQTLQPPLPSLIPAALPRLRPPSQPMESPLQHALPPTLPPTPPPSLPSPSFSPLPPSSPLSSLTPPPLPSYQQKISVPPMKLQSFSLQESTLLTHVPLTAIESMATNITLAPSQPQSISSSERFPANLYKKTSESVTLSPLFPPCETILTETNKTTSNNLNTPQNASIWDKNPKYFDRTVVNSLMKKKQSSNKCYRAPTEKAGLKSGEGNSLKKFPEQPIVTSLAFEVKGVSNSELSENLRHSIKNTRSKKRNGFKSYQKKFSRNNMKSKVSVRHRKSKLKRIKKVNKNHVQHKSNKTLKNLNLLKKPIHLVKGPHILKPHKTIKEFVDHTSGEPISFKYIEDEENIEISFEPLKVYSGSNVSKTPSDINNLKSVVGPDNYKAVAQETSLVKPDAIVLETEDESSNDCCVKHKIINGCRESLTISPKVSSIFETEATFSDCTNQVAIEKDKDIGSSIFVLVHNHMSEQVVSDSSKSKASFDYNNLTLGNSDHYKQTEQTGYLKKDLEGSTSEDESENEYVRPRIINGFGEPLILSSGASNNENKTYLLPAIPSKFKNQIVVDEKNKEIDQTSFPPKHYKHGQVGCVLSESKASYDDTNMTTLVKPKNFNHIEKQGLLKEDLAVSESQNNSENEIHMKQSNNDFGEPVILTSNESSTSTDGYKMHTFQTKPPNIKIKTDKGKNQTPKLPNMHSNNASKSKSLSDNNSLSLVVDEPKTCKQFDEQGLLEEDLAVSESEDECDKLPVRPRIRIGYEEHSECSSTSTSDYKTHQFQTKPSDLKTQIGVVKTDKKKVRTPPSAEHIIHGNKSITRKDLSNDNSLARIVESTERLKVGTDRKKPTLKSHNLKKVKTKINCRKYTKSTLKCSFNTVIDPSRPLVIKLKSRNLKHKNVNMNHSIYTSVKSDVRETIKPKSFLQSLKVRSCTENHGNEVKQNLPLSSKYEVVKKYNKEIENQNKKRKFSRSSSTNLRTNESLHKPSDLKKRLTSQVERVFTVDKDTIDTGSPLQNKSFMTKSQNKQLPLKRSCSMPAGPIKEIKSANLMDEILSTMDNPFNFKNKVDDNKNNSQISVFGFPYTQMTASNYRKYSYYQNKGNLVSPPDKETALNNSNNTYKSENKNTSTYNGNFFLNHCDKTKINEINPIIKPNTKKEIEDYRLKNSVNIKPAPSKDKFKEKTFYKNTGQTMPLQINNVTIPNQRKNNLCKPQSKSHLATNDSKETINWKKKGVLERFTKKNKQKLREEENNERPSLKELNMLPSMPVIVTEETKGCSGQIQPLLAKTKKVGEVTKKCCSEPNGTKKTNSSHSQSSGFSLKVSIPIKLLNNISFLKTNTFIRTKIECDSQEEKVSSRMLLLENKHHIDKSTKGNITKINNYKSVEEINLYKRKGTESKNTSRIEKGNFNYSTQQSLEEPPTKKTKSCVIEGKKSLKKTEKHKKTQKTEIKNCSSNRNKSLKNNLNLKPCSNSIDEIKTKRIVECTENVSSKRPCTGKALGESPSDKLNGPRNKAVLQSDDPVFTTLDDCLVTTTPGIKPSKESSGSVSRTYIGIETELHGATINSTSSQEYYSSEVEVSSKEEDTITLYANENSTEVLPKESILYSSETAKKQCDKKEAPKEVATEQTLKLNCHKDSHLAIKPLPTFKETNIPFSSENPAELVAMAEENISATCSQAVEKRRISVVSHEHLFFGDASDNIDKNTVPQSVQKRRISVLNHDDLFDNGSKINTEHVNKRQTWYMSPEASVSSSENEISIKDVQSIYSATSHLTNNVVMRQKFLNDFQSLILKVNSDFEKLTDFIEILELDFKQNNEEIISVKKLPSQDVVELELNRIRKEFQNKLIERENNFKETLLAFIQKFTNKDIQGSVFMAIYVQLSQKVVSLCKEKTEVKEKFLYILKKWLTTDESKYLFDQKLKDFERDYNTMKKWLDESLSLNQLDTLCKSSDDMSNLKCSIKEPTEITPVDIGIVIPSTKDLEVINNSHGSPLVLPSQSQNIDISSSNSQINFVDQSSNQNHPVKTENITVNAQFSQMASTTSSTNGIGFCVTNVSCQHKQRRQENINNSPEVLISTNSIQTKTLTQSNLIENSVHCQNRKAPITQESADLFSNKNPDLFSTPNSNQQTSDEQCQNTNKRLHHHHPTHYSTYSNQTGFPLHEAITANVNSSHCMPQVSSGTSQENLLISNNIDNGSSNGRVILDAQSNNFNLSSVLPKNSPLNERNCQYPLQTGEQTSSQLNYRQKLNQRTIVNSNRMNPHSNLSTRFQTPLAMQQLQNQSQTQNITSNTVFNSEHIAQKNLSSCNRGYILPKQNNQQAEIMTQPYARQQNQTNPNVSYPKVPHQVNSLTEENIMFADHQKQITFVLPPILQTNFLIQPQNLVQQQNHQIHSSLLENTYNGQPTQGNYSSNCTTVYLNNAFIPTVQSQATLFSNQLLQNGVVSRSHPKPNTLQPQVLQDTYPISKTLGQNQLIAQPQEARSNSMNYEPPPARVLGFNELNHQTTAPLNVQLSHTDNNFEEYGNMGTNVLSFGQASSPTNFQNQNRLAHSSQILNKNREDNQHLNQTSYTDSQIKDMSYVSSQRNEILNGYGFTEVDCEKISSIIQNNTQFHSHVSQNPQGIQQTSIEESLTMLPNHNNHTTQPMNKSIYSNSNQSSGSIAIVLDQITEFQDKLNNPRNNSNIIDIEGIKLLMEDFSTFLNILKRQVIVSKLNNNDKITFVSSLTINEKQFSALVLNILTNFVLREIKKVPSHQNDASNRECLDEPRRYNMQQPEVFTDKSCSENEQFPNSDMDIDVNRLMNDALKDFQNGSKNMLLLNKCAEQGCEKSRAALKHIMDKLKIQKRRP